MQWDNKVYIDERTGLCCKPCNETTRYILTRGLVSAVNHAVYIGQINGLCCMSSIIHWLGKWCMRVRWRDIELFCYPCKHYILCLHIIVIAGWLTPLIKHYYINYNWWPILLTKLSTLIFCQPSIFKDWSENWSILWTKLT